LVFPKPFPGLKERGEREKKKGRWAAYLVINPEKGKEEGEEKKKKKKEKRNPPISNNFPEKVRGKGREREIKFDLNHRLLKGGK